LCLSSLGVDILDVNLREQYLMAFQEALEWEKSRLLEAKVGLLARAEFFQGLLILPFTGSKNEWWMCF
jgi:hypothetical protein